MDRKVEEETLFTKMALTPNNKNHYLIQNGTLVLPNGQLFDGQLRLIDGVIESIEPNHAELQGAELIDAKGCYVTPGLIDPHINGGFGVAFNNATEAQMGDFLEQIAFEGITAILPTLITAPKISLVKQMTTIEGLITRYDPKKQSKILGIHLEGPFLSPKQRGAHPEQHLLPLTRQHLQDLLSPNLKRLTLAPELAGQEALSLIHELTQKGTCCSIGHTNATLEQAAQAIHAGVNSATHLFNAMRGIHHRDPGVVMACLLNPNLFLEIIADGQHLAKETIELIFRLGRSNKLFLTTDANPLYGLKTNAEVSFGEMQIRLENGQSVNEENRLAGSHISLSQQVRNLVGWGLTRFEEAIELCTYNPALFLGVENYLGQLAEDRVADVLLWDKRQLAIKQVFLAGNPLFALPHQQALSA